MASLETLDLDAALVAGGWAPDLAAAATQRLSRPATAHAALRRCGLLGRRHLRVTLAGADRHEGALSAAVAAELFAPLARALAAEGTLSLRLLLQGPSVPRRLPAAVSLGYPFTPAAGPPAPGEPWLRVAFAHGCLCSGDAGDVPALSDDADWAHAPPHLVLVFNAGVWGYGGWVPSIAAAARVLRAPVVITAYSCSEAEGDEDALTAAGLALGWEAEANPVGSRAPWAETAGGVAHQGEARAENAWWLCVAPADV